MPIVRIILQARLSSRRLPAKCLLPLGGVPLVVLSALRASNTGMPVVVATSLEEEDEILADTVRKYGFTCGRGSLNDVYNRFLMVTEDMADDHWIVRLTADNCFPDGAFISSLLEQAIERNVQYLGTSSPIDGLPYGLSVEVFTAKALRSTVGEELSNFEREHVTPAIRRKYGAGVAEFDCKAWAHLRCTVDTRFDYFSLLRLFSSITDPVQASWRHLCECLSEQEGATGFRIPWKKHQQGTVGSITLGTAQIGIQHYGRVNSKGQPSQEEAYQLLETAVRHGITHIDTARAYGDAEKRLGSHIDQGLYFEPTIITKLDPFSDLADDASEKEMLKWIEASIYKSCHALRTKQLKILMLHRWNHYNSHHRYIWRTLCQFKNEKIIDQLGASVSSPDQAMEAFAEKEIKHLQIPFNMLDHRWLSEGFKKAREQRPDVVVYARSAYLQGILASDAKDWPQRDGYDTIKAVKQIDNLVHTFGRRNRADLCMAYLNASELIDTIVIGMETLFQLKENLSLACLTPLNKNEMAIVEKTFKDTPEWLLDPSQWS